jgi:hypothetical protein
VGELEVYFDSDPHGFARLRAGEEFFHLASQRHPFCKERALVGEVISTVANAGQISREFCVSDHGIEMEIEFKNDAGEATGWKLYLVLDP